MPSPPVVPLRLQATVAGAERAFLAAAKSARPSGVGLVRDWKIVCTIDWPDTRPGNGIDVAICSDRIESSAMPQPRIIGWVWRQFAPARRYDRHGSTWLDIGFAGLSEAQDFFRLYHDVRVGLINPDVLSPVVSHSPAEVSALLVPSRSTIRLDEGDIAATFGQPTDNGTRSLLDQYREATAGITHATVADKHARQRIGLDLLWRALSRRHAVSCQLTGLQEQAHLRVTHIKSWAASSDAERMDLSNVLVLTAHIDEAFGPGFVSFDDDGSLLVSSEFRDYCQLRELPFLATGHLRPKPNKFMQRYLAWHRAHVYRRAPSARIFTPNWLGSFQGHRGGSK